MTPFTTVKIRTAAAVIYDQQVALIRRVKDSVEQYTLPGGNVEPGEDLLDGLRRELAEELGLHLDADVAPDLLAVQDQMVTRPGPTPPPRKLHLIFRVLVTSGQRAAIALSSTTISLTARLCGCPSWRWPAYICSRPWVTWWPDSTRSSRPAPYCCGP